MKTLKVIAAAAILFTLFNSCTKVIGEGPIVSETRIVRDFSEIDFGVPGELIYVNSNENEIEIEAQRNIIDVIETYVSGGELKVRVRDGKNIRSSEEIRVIVRSANINSLAVSGSGTLTTDDVFDPSDATLRVSGSGKIRISHIASDNLDARISGSGSIHVQNGTADTEIVNISGSGEVNLLPVEARRASTQTSGSGNIRLRVTDELDVRISGSGDVYYEGNPVVDVKVSGSGRVVQL